ncbi:MAG: PQQ-binding-like beta-propeller repeat protein [Candidatus Paceibacterota bacterium]|jgi:outer membrane protein assembly factor BamB/orotate phosphoribosyltransferase
MESSQLKLKEVIEKEVFITKKEARSVDQNGTETDWIFDFRKVLLGAEILNIVSELFWEKFKNEHPFQIGGIEVASIPLITAFVLKVREKNKISNGFFIRKSRKKSGLLRMIEGEISNDKIILVDDIINSGKSFIRQIEVIESLGKKVSAVFVILRFRDLPYYSYLTERGIKIISLFTLEDFGGSLGVSNLIDKTELPVPTPFKIDWYFKSEKPNYFLVTAKSAPAVDKEKIYFGGDNGVFWALNQIDGKAVWDYKILLGAQKRKAFSSPVVYKDVVYFGANDGNFYALNSSTGKRKWVFLEADWIGSSPCIAEDIGAIFVGLEFGLWKKQGALVALDSSSGEKMWEFSMSDFTQSSPAYSSKLGIVICGCNDFSVYGLDVKTGKLLWTFKTEGEIKGSFSFDEKLGVVVFGSFDSCVYVLETKTGKLIHKIKTDEAIFSTPTVNDGFAYVSSLDKSLYCIDLDKGVVVWKFKTNARIFSSPEIIDDSVYIGSNDGRLYELDLKTGKNTAFFQATERITDKIAFNKTTGRIFLPTFANEIYCLSKNKKPE